MNGIVNGTMEESANATVTEPSTDNKTASNKCDSPKDIDRSKNLENDTHSDEYDERPEKNLKLADNSNIEADEKSDNGCTDVLVEKNSIDPLLNHCSDSEKSLSESGTSSQTKSKTTANMAEVADNSVHEKSDYDNSVMEPDKTITLNEETHVIGSESSSEDGSVVSVEPIVEDTVSIDSDSDDHDDTSQDSQDRDKNNDVIFVGNGPHSVNGDSFDSASPIVQEINSDNDDCFVTDDSKSNSNPSTDRRRSSRHTTQKRYDFDLENGDDESDIEEVEMDDPLEGKTLNLNIPISNAKILFEPPAKKRKICKKGNEKKEPAVVILDSKSSKGQITEENNSNIKKLYQSIVARGTTVTPISSKTTSTATQISPQTPQPAILPSLTDDMFVVEAPSFIVPYVYEKPSLKPFREFVDKLGKELEEQKAKEEKERQEKYKEEKELREKDRKERKERGEQVSASEDEAMQQENMKKKAEKRAKRRRRKDYDDDASWDGESTSESDDDETLSDQDMFIIKAKPDSVEDIKEVTSLTLNKVGLCKSDSYFDCSLGKFFMNIGLNLVQEHVQADLLKQQNRKLAREKKKGQSTKETQSAIASLTKNLEFSKENNAPYTFILKKCDLCSFKTESLLALNHHLETPHMKNNLYKCNFCEYEIKSPHDILAHMEINHQVRGKLERAPSHHQCINCPFEDNSKGKLARHAVGCAKKFKPDQNLAPPIEWEPPAKIPKITRAKNNMLLYQQNMMNRQLNTMVRPPINVTNIAVSGAGLGVAGGGFRARGRSPLVGTPRAAAPAPFPRPRTNPTAAGSQLSSYSLANNAKSKSQQPSLSITPLPRLPQPAPRLPQPTPSLPAPKNTFVICEICDGYIKDLEQLRNHMQWIHKVKIHPKMIYNRPPLNCQKCQFRFFTDQGLERHLLGSHGLVTSSMQEAANKGKDAGRCPVCGRVYQWKLLSHVARDHSLTLKPAHLSYKCTVCTATFGMYKQFENHVYSAHSVVAKRVMEKNKASAASSKPADVLPKPLKINDQITITPQPVKTATSTKSK